MVGGVNQLVTPRGRVPHAQPDPTRSKAAQRGEVATVEGVDGESPIFGNFSQRETRQPGVCRGITGLQGLAVRLFKAEHGHSLEANRDVLLLIIFLDLLHDRREDVDRPLTFADEAVDPLPLAISPSVCVAVQRDDQTVAPRLGVAGDGVFSADEHRGSGLLGAP